MRILYIASRNPFPPVGGHKIRVYNFLKKLSQEARVTLAIVQSPIDKPSPSVALTESQKEVRERLSIVGTQIRLPIAVAKFARGMLPAGRPLQLQLFDTRRGRRLLARIDEEKWDLAIFHMARMGQFYELIDCDRKVLDLVDALPRAYNEAARHRFSIGSVIKRLEARRLAEWENKHVTAFNECWVTSTRDQEYYTGRDLGENVRVVPNGVDAEYFHFRPNDGHGARLVFVGSFAHEPNVDAVVHFCQRILPRIRSGLPEVRLDLVGLSPPKEIRELDGESVTVHGTVDDVRPYVYAASASICPIRMGAGIQNKILESMAMGTPVVASETAAAGILEEGRRAMIVADVQDEYEFAQRTINLLSDPDLQESLSHRARSFVENSYQWERIVEECL